MPEKLEKLFIGPKQFFLSQFEVEKEKEIVINMNWVQATK